MSPTPKQPTEAQNICRQFTNENKDGVHRWAIEIGRNHKQAFEPKFSSDNKPILVLRDDTHDTEIHIGDWLIVTDNGILPCRANQSIIRKPFY